MLSTISEVVNVELADELARHPWPDCPQYRPEFKPTLAVLPDASRSMQSRDAVDPGHKTAAPAISQRRPGGISGPNAIAGRTKSIEGAPSLARVADDAKHKRDAYSTEFRRWRRRLARAMHLGTTFVDLLR